MSEIFFIIVATGLQVGRVNGKQVKIEHFVRQSRLISARGFRKTRKFARVRLVRDHVSVKTIVIGIIDDRPSDLHRRFLISQRGIEKNLVQFRIPHELTEPVFFRRLAQSDDVFRREQAVRRRSQSKPGVGNHFILRVELFVRPRFGSQNSSEFVRIRFVFGDSYPHTYGEFFFSRRFEVIRHRFLLHFRRRTRFCGRFAAGNRSAATSAAQNTLSAQAIVFFKKFIFVLPFSVLFVLFAFLSYSVAISSVDFSVAKIAFPFRFHYAIADPVCKHQKYNIPLFF